MLNPPLDTEAILRALITQKVEFVIVGGLSAVFHGVLILRSTLARINQRDAASNE